MLNARGYSNTYDLYNDLVRMYNDNQSLQLFAVGTYDALLVHASDARHSWLKHGVTKRNYRF